MSPSGESRGDALDFVNELLAEEEDEALAALTPNPRHAAMRARGIDPPRAQTLLERVLAEQGLAEPGLAEPVVPRRELPAARPVQATDAVDIRNRWRASWLPFAIAAGMAIAAGTIARPAIVAWRTPAPAPSSAHTTEAPPPGPTPEEVAAVLRRDALAACAKRDYPTCESGLDRAKESDPAGEEDVRVQEARTAVRRAKLSAPPVGAKP